DMTITRYIPISFSYLPCPEPIFGTDVTEIRPARITCCYNWKCDSNPFHGSLGISTPRRDEVLRTSRHRRRRG
ncbi:MAG TPA: hypothetical protein VFJ18_11565, partial [Pararhizobium sp.]|nr:hypothetical protein [Pararhizobium sp.]